jgi:hypothetical protein
MDGPSAGRDRLMWNMLIEKNGNIRHARDVARMPHCGTFDRSMGSPDASPKAIALGRPNLRMLEASSDSVIQNKS